MLQEPRVASEIAFHCPACQQLVRVLTPVSPFYLQPGPSLTCQHCLAIIAVTLTVAWPGPRPVPAREDPHA